MLSKDEFCGFGIDFYITKDESCPSKNLFGPLAE
jgi:hypothetical protein